MLTVIENAKLKSEIRQLKMDVDIVDILKKGGELLRESKVARFEFIKAQAAVHPVDAICRNMQVSTSGYYPGRMAKSLPGRRPILH